MDTTSEAGQKGIASFGSQKHCILEKKVNSLFPLYCFANFLDATETFVDSFVEMKELAKRRLNQLSHFGRLISESAFLVITIG